MSYDEHQDSAEAPDESRSGGDRLRLGLALCGLLALALGGLCLLLTLPALAEAKARADQVKCAHSLRQLGLAALQYAGDNRLYTYSADGDVQATVSVLQQTGYLDSTQGFACPAAEGASSYKGFMAPYSRHIRGDTLLAWDAVPHQVNGQSVRNTLMGDCTIRKMSAADFDAALAKHDALVKQTLNARGPQ